MCNGICEKKILWDKKNVCNEICDEKALCEAKKKKMLVMKYVMKNVFEGKKRDVWNALMWKNNVCNEICDEKRYTYNWIQKYI